MRSQCGTYHLRLFAIAAAGKFGEFLLMLLSFAWCQKHIVTVGVVAGIVTI